MHNNDDFCMKSGWVCTFLYENSTKIADSSLIRGHSACIRVSRIAEEGSFVVSTRNLSASRLLNALLSLHKVRKKAFSVNFGGENLCNSISVYHPCTKRELVPCTGWIGAGHKAPRYNACVKCAMTTTTEIGCQNSLGQVVSARLLSRRHYRRTKVRALEYSLKAVAPISP